MHVIIGIQRVQNKQCCRNVKFCKGYFILCYATKERRTITIMVIFVDDAIYD